MLNNSRATQQAGSAARPMLGCALVCLIACALLASPPSCRALGRNYEVKQVAPGVFVWAPDDIVDQSGDPYFSRAGNAGFIITPDGVAVINTANNPFHAAEILYEIRQRTQLPVRLVIDLGSQGDEMLGNEIFAAQRADIISTAAADAAMQAYQRDLERRLTFDPELPVRMRGIHFTLPGQTFTGESSMTLGGVQIRMTAMNCGLPGQAGGDAVVYLPQTKVLFLGDLYVKGFVPQIGSRDVGRWIGALSEVGHWNVATYVPGHGDPGAQAGLANFKGFLEWLEAGVAAGVNQGKSLSDVEQRLLSSSAFNLLALDLAPRTIEEVYNQTVRAALRRRAAKESIPAPAVTQQRVPSANGVRGFTGANPAAPRE